MIFFCNYEMYFFIENYKKLDINIWGYFLYSCKVLCVVLFYSLIICNIGL